MTEGTNGRAVSCEQVAEAKGVYEVKHSSPVPEGAGLLFVSSCEAAGGQTISAEFEYKNSCF